ncbi:MAG: tetratricopeptide repeat protein [Candidatus Poribacteria bacterium]
MSTYQQIQQLSSLTATIDDLLTDPKVAAWHSALLQEAKTSFSQIQQEATSAVQENLVERMMQQLADVEREIQVSLQAPLQSLRRVADTNNIPEQQKAKLFIQLGQTYDIIGQWNQALDIFYKALDFCEQNSAAKAETLKFLGHLKSKQREYSAATRLYLDSLAIYTALNQKHDIAHIYLCQGYNYFEQGNYQQAEDYYRLALQLGSEQADQQIIADGNNNLGIIATVRGNFDDAIAYYTRSVAAYESIDDIPGLSTAYHNLAMLQVDTAKWQEAGASYQTALEYAQQAGNLELMGLIHLNRAELALKLYDFAMAEACCKHALKVFGRLGSQTRIAEAYKFLGCAFSRQKKWDDARRLFQRSIEVNDSVNNQLGIAETRYEYGLMYLNKGNQDNAKQQLTQSLEIFEELSATADVEKVKAELAKLSKEKEGKAKLKRISRIKR